MATRNPNNLHASVPSTLNSGDRIFEDQTLGWENEIHAYRHGLTDCLQFQQIIVSKLDISGLGSHLFGIVETLS